MKFEVLDDVLASDHLARVIDHVVGSLDLARFTERAKAVHGRAGRCTTSPRMLLTLLMYGLVRGIGSAREIARLTTSDDGFRWIVGDVQVHHDVVTRFRVQHGAALSGLLTDLLASLAHKELFNLDVAALDGTRVRASASAPSFRRLPSLLECREQATLHLKAVMAEVDDPEQSTTRRAAREAGARDRQRRVEEAVATVVQLQEKAEKPERSRASTTDKDARVMKMPDGGFRPAYNIQLGTVGDKMGGPRTIVGVGVTNSGSDLGSITPMLGQIRERTGTVPKVLLADGGCVKLSCIEAAGKDGVDVIAPPMKKGAKNEPTPKRRDTPHVKAWRDHMMTDEAKRLYRERPGLAELSNAVFKQRFGLTHVLVRGRDKVTCVALLAAITFNILQHAAVLGN